MLATFPVSTATAERSFSTLWHLKTYMRTTLETVSLAWLLCHGIQSAPSTKRKFLVLYASKRRRSHFGVKLDLAVWLRWQWFCTWKTYPVTVKSITCGLRRLQIFLAIFWSAVLQGGVGWKFPLVLLCRAHVNYFFKYCEWMCHSVCIFLNVNFAAVLLRLLYAMFIFYTSRIYILYKPFCLYEGSCLLRALSQFLLYP